MNVEFFRDIESEKFVVGSLVIEPEYFDDVAAVVKPVHFFNFLNRAIYTEMVAAVDVGDPIYLPKIVESVSASLSCEKSFVAEEIRQMVEAIPSASRAAAFARRVYDAARRRSIQQAGLALLRDAEDKTRHVDEALATAYDELAAHDEAALGVPWTADQGQLKTWEALDNKLDGKVAHGLDSGLRSLDAITGGVAEGNLMIIAGRPGHGKSSLAIQYACNQAVDKGRSVLFSSLEMSVVEIYQRIWSWRTSIPHQFIRDARLTTEQQRTIADFHATTKNCKLFIDDPSRRSVSELATLARRVKRNDGLDMLVIDYLQLVEPEDRRVPRHEQVAQMTRRLKSLARELRIPIVCLAQLNREGDKGGSREPKLSDLRESGAIEQDADTVILIHRDKVQDGHESNKAKLIVAKNRAGRTGMVEVDWDGSTTSFGMPSSDFIASNFGGEF